MPATSIYTSPPPWREKNTCSINWGRSSHTHTHTRIYTLDIDAHFLIFPCLECAALSVCTSDHVHIHTHTHTHTHIHWKLWSMEAKPCIVTLTGLQEAQLLLTTVLRGTYRAELLVYIVLYKSSRGLQLLHTRTQSLPDTHKVCMKGLITHFNRTLLISLHCMALSLNLSSHFSLSCVCMLSRMFAKW